MCRGNRVTDQKSDLLTAVSCILARADELAVRAAELQYQFKLVAEFAALFHKEIPVELPSLRNINQKITIISG